MSTNGGRYNTSCTGIVAAAFAAVLALIAITVNANDWPCYRGTNSDGHTDEKITIWPPVELWRANVGQGFSQVVVSKGKVYTMGWSNNQNHISCYSETSTGVDPTPVWKTSYSSAAGNNGGTSLSGTYSTPAVDGGQVYTFDNYGILNCYNATNGALLWSSTAFSGGGPNGAGSPFVEGDLVLVNAGGNNGVGAISKTTHNVVWGANGTGERYTSPFAATIGAQRTIVGYGVNMTGLDPATGSVLWYYPNPVPTHSGGVANPMIVGGSKLFVSEGYNSGCSLFDLTGASGQLTSRTWHNNNLCTKENAAGIYNGYAYGASEPGTGSGLTCLNLANGSAAWQQTGFAPESAVLSAGDQLIVMTGDNNGNAPAFAGNGDLVVAQASSTAYTELHRLTKVLSDYTWTVPTLCNGNLYIHSRDGTLICYQVGQPPPSSGTSGYRMPITFSGYTPIVPGTLTNFPALVVLSNNINNSAFDFAQMVSPSDGADLRFYSADTVTELKYEIDTWNPNGTSYIWVQVPALGSTNDFIWAYWGDPGSSTAPAYRSNGGAWDSTFVGVWHLGEAVTNGGIQHDSTANHLDGTFTAISPSAAGIPAVIGNGDHINSSGGLHIPDNPKLHVLQQMTWSVWSKSDNPNSVGWNGFMLMFANDLYLGPHPGFGYAEVQFANYDVPGGRHSCYYTAPNIAAWNYWGGVLDANSGQEYLYFNGYNNVDTTLASMMHRTDCVTTMNHGDGSGLGIGFNPDNPNGNQLSLDEARLESIPRASNWMWSCYMTMASNSSFQTYGQAGGISPVTGIVQFASAAYSVPENGGSVTVKVFRLNGPSGAVTVDFATSDGTGHAGVNYVATNGTLSYANGETSKTFAVSVMDDGTWEPGNLTVNLGLSHTTGNAMFGSPASAVLTIVDVDGPGSFQFSSSGYAVSEDAGTMSITVTRANGKTGAASVSYATSDGTAQNGVNYATTSGTLNFANNETSKTFAVTILNQPVGDSGKTVNLMLSNPTGGATVGTPGTAVLKIVLPGPFSTWSYKMNIQFPGYSNATGQTLMNFPVSLIFSNNMSGGFNYSQVAPNGGDLRFADGTKTNALNFEIEKWVTNGPSYVWVEVPVMANNCSIWAFWGGPTTDLPVYATNGATWNSDFKGVWHLGELNGATSHYDSTVNGNNATISGTTSMGTTGVVDGAAGYSGTDIGRITNMNNSLTITGNALTVGIWVYPSIPFNQAVKVGFLGKLQESGGSGADYGIFYDWTSVYFAGGGKTFGTGYDLPINTWTYMVGVCDGSYLRFYVNGVQYSSTACSGNTPNTSGFSVLLGGGDYGGKLNGKLDEGRIMAAAASSNWVWTSYLNMASNSAFCVYGASVSSNAPPVITSSTTANGAVGQTFSYQITASGNPTNYNATGLPAGLSINRNTGLISGTPGTNGITAVTITAVNSYGTGSATLNITINVAGIGPSGLVGWWKLDESSGTTASDSSGSGNNGTLNGAPVWQPAGGQLAGALNFNYGDYVNCGSTASLSIPSVTVAFWMKPSQMAIMCPVDKLPVDTGVGYAVRLRDTGAIWFRLGSEPGTAYDVYADALYTNGVWTHVACTFDSGTGAARLYINGVMAAHQPTYPIVLSTATTPFLMAKENKTGNEPYVGLLDDVRVYDHALTAGEIATVMAGGSGGVQPPVVWITPKTSQPGMIQLSWQSSVGATYAVYRTTNLLVGWPAQPLTNIVGDGAAKAFSEQMGTLKAAYYRLKAVGN